MNDVTDGEASSVLIRGVGLSGFRSISDEPIVRFGPLAKVTLLAGPNNAGKSNILLAAASFLQWDKPRPALTELDTPINMRGGSILPRLMIAFDESDAPIVNARNQIRAKTGEDSRLQRLLDSKTLRATEDDLIWFEFDIPSNSGGSAPSISSRMISRLTDEMDPRDLGRLSTDFTNEAGGERGQDASRVLNAFRSFEAIPDVKMVGTFRQVLAGEGHTELEDLTGTDLIPALRSLQSPTALEFAKKRKFGEINRFVRAVLGDPDASIDIPHDGSTINIARGETELLPLAHYGTGIQQLIILAAAATILEGKVLLVEEPELNLHPVIQRKLVRYMLENTSNQYIIATHSAHMLDYERAAVFRVTKGESGTEVSSATTPSQVSNICADLGYRPSDLIQSNAVVWVEGPSDRIYVRHWIDKLSNGRLLEGIHYSIMFYGGGLLSSLSRDDPEIDDFISLRYINRSMGVIIDSDKHKSSEAINATKERVVREMSTSQDKSVVWVTDGYTIENYVPVDLLVKAFSVVHPTKKLRSGSKWTDPLRAEGGQRFTPNKPRIARLVCEDWEKSAFPEHVTEKVCELIAMLDAANDLDNSD